MPPAHWLMTRSPDQEVNIHRKPEAEVGPICSTAVGKAEPFGCSLIYPLADGACDIYVSSDLPERSRRIVELHELAHCNGWPADHPTE